MSKLRAGFAVFSLLAGIATACGGSARVDGAGAAGGSNSAGAAGSGFSGSSSGGSAGNLSSWGACHKDTECTLLNPGCCQACEPLAASDFLPLNFAHLTEYTNSVTCDPIACTPCPPSSELTETGKFFKPACVSGQCSAVDIRETAITACQVDADCMLRAGVACCTSCTDNFVAVNVGSDFCPDGPLPCPKCASIIPEGLAARCAQQHCVLKAYAP